MPAARKLDDVVVPLLAAPVARVVAAAALHTSFDKVTVQVKNTTLPERFMSFLDSVEPNISSVKHYGLRLDRDAPVIC